jgi:hypothetical protein
MGAIVTNRMKTSSSHAIAWATTTKVSPLAIWSDTSDILSSPVSKKVQITTMRRKRKPQEYRASAKPSASLEEHRPFVKGSHHTHRQQSEVSYR